MTVDMLLDLIYQNADFDTLGKILGFTAPIKTRSRTSFNILDVIPDIQVRASKHTESPAMDVEQCEKAAPSVVKYSPVALSVADKSNTVELNQVFCNDISFEPGRYLQYSCTDSSESVNLVQLGNGQIVLMGHHTLTSGLGIVAVLQFSPNDPGLSYQYAVPEPMTVRGIDWVDFERRGFCRGCKDLVYIPPIPEGVESLAGAFQGCVKLNCPIYLPKSIKDCRYMLQSCISFDNEIFVPYDLDIDSVDGLKEYSQHIRRMGG